jgi:LacI family transcriptional regulator
LRKLVDTGKLVVSIGELADIETHMVDFDDQNGNKLAMDYLIDKGHRCIACLAGAETSTFARHRIMGWVESLMNHGIPVDNTLLLRAGDTLAGGYEAAREVLTHRPQRPTALVCFNDLIAIGAYQAAHDLGIQIPDDLSVVGFDDCQMAAVMGPPLTTVATYPTELGKQIAEIILSVHQSPIVNGFLHRRTYPRLIERQSIKAL